MIELITQIGILCLLVFLIAYMIWDIHVARPWHDEIAGHEDATSRLQTVIENHKISMMEHEVDTVIDDLKDI